MSKRTCAYCWSLEEGKHDPRCPVGNEIAAQEKACREKKHVFTSEKKAKKGMKKARAEMIDRVYYYKCPVCDFYHLTKYKPEKYQRYRYEQRLGKKKN